jgi:probable rRNA maturation factor
MKYQAHLHASPDYQDVGVDLTAVALAVLEYEGVAAGDLTIVLTDDNAIRELNLQYAGLDRSTDVLSFEDGGLDPETDRIYYGDVIVSVPTALQQAHTANHSLPEELTLLTVHGMLHLLGYDHAQALDKERMWKTQTAILRTLGLDIVLPEDAA